jgi:hypothetical protein
MIFSDLPSPAEASNEEAAVYEGFAQAGNRYPLSDRSEGRLFRDHALAQGATAATAAKCLSADLRSHYSLPRNA